MACTCIHMTCTSACIHIQAQLARLALAASSARPVLAHVQRDPSRLLQPTAASAREARTKPSNPNFNPNPNPSPSPNPNPDQVEIVDLAPTVMALLGLPVPRDCTGVFIDDVVG